MGTCVTKILKNNDYHSVMEISQKQRFGWENVKIDLNACSVSQNGTQGYARQIILIICKNLTLKNALLIMLIFCNHTSKESLIFFCVQIHYFLDANFV